MFLAAIAATYVYIQATRQLFSGFKGLIHQRLIGLLRKIIHYYQKRIIKKDYSLFPKIKKDNSGKSSTVSGFKGLIHQRLRALLRKIIDYYQNRIIKKVYSLFPKIKKDNSGKSSTVSGFKGLTHQRLSSSLKSQRKSNTQHRVHCTM